MSTSLVPAYDAVPGDNGEGIQQDMRSRQASENFPELKRTQLVDICVLGVNAETANMPKDLKKREHIFKTEAVLPHYNLHAPKKLGRSL